MKNGPFLVACSTVLALAGVVGWRASIPDPVPDAEQGPIAQQPDAPAPRATERVYVPGPIQPIPDYIALDADKVWLGERLFHDPRLSVDGTVSCSSCHSLSGGGDDSLPVSVGVGGALGEVNAPTVFNCAFNFTQFWDGRARTLEDQVDGPIHHPKEMGSSWAAILVVLRQDSEYLTAFQASYGAGPDEASIKDAIVTFERSLYTPNAPFDRWLKGEEGALTADELAGYELFMDVGCVTCHQGVNIGGNMFQVFGKFHPYYEDHEINSRADLGRFNVTGRERDRHAFKVPTLRNVALTAPYLHDGSMTSLGEVVSTMAWYELGAELDDGEVSLIVAFLESLTGEFERDDR
jgi:cytochrome c peroxidase